MPRFSSYRQFMFTRCAATLRRAIVASMALAALPMSHAQTAGTFDASFGVGGKVTNFFVGPNTGSSSAVAMAVQADGKTLLAGSCRATESSSDTACIARLLPDGQVDTSFTGPAGNAPGKFLLPFAETEWSGIKVVEVGADGKILVAAECSNGVELKICTMRLTASGALDPTFNGGSGPGGELQYTDPSVLPRVQALKIQPDGKTVFLFRCYPDGFCLQRINVNGSLDTSFDGPNANGTGVGTGNGRFRLELFGIGGEYPNDLALTADGKLVATGSCIGPNGYGVCVVRLNSNGSYDTSFDGPNGGGNGRAVFGVNGGDFATGSSVAIQPDGKIVIGGYCGNSSASWRMCGVRLTTSGAFDPEFAGPSANASGRFRFAVVGEGAEQVKRVAIQDDGRILLAGICENPAPSTNGNDFCFARLNSDGSFDTSFDGPAGNGNGRFRIGIAQDMDILDGIALRPDGRIVAGGTCSDTCGGSCGGNAFCVAQFHGGSQGYETCSLDIDGDGVVGITDAIMHARLALGFQGSALTNGLSFASNAVRTNSGDIRNHLITQCGWVSP